ncbi:YraN family protein [Sodalinema gerasimenkoae]|uniref:YraN family protein n=1 Tax=Sodalinema gerasimenkoae TaxID=2862348 RepID=UPI00135A7716|nr:YraN family protein [Sodalinema gerasimenkoae]
MTKGYSTSDNSRFKGHPTRNIVGTLGEDLVAQWLRGAGVRVLHQRWRCRLGELDIVAGFPATPETAKTLAFVEVKTRSRGNWDHDGRLALSPAKCQRLNQAARLFLSRFPQYAQLPCRFDLALVRSQRAPQGSATSPTTPKLPNDITIGQPVLVNQLQLTLQEYLVGVLD